MKSAPGVSRVIVMEAARKATAESIVGWTSGIRLLTVSAMTINDSPEAMDMKIGIGFLDSLRRPWLKKDSQDVRVIHLLNLIDEINKDLTPEKALEQLKSYRRWLREEFSSACQVYEIFEDRGINASSDPELDQIQDLMKIADQLISQLQPQES